LTLARARVADGNGAGIRLEGRSLRLEGVQFINNQVGVLSGADGSGVIWVAGCRFEGGVAGDQPSVALAIGAAALLHVERSVFAGARGDQVRSSALRTEIISNQIATAGLAVSVAGGALLLEDNVLELTPDGRGRQAAVLATGDTRVTMRRNRLLNRTGRPATLLLDWTGGAPVAEGNVVAVADRELASDGLWRHRGAAAFRGMKDSVRGMLIAARQVLRP